MDKASRGSEKPSDRAGSHDDPVRRFNRWRGEGRRPDLKRFLSDAGKLSPAELAAILRELNPAELAGILRVDLCERWRRGERVTAEFYLSEYLPAPVDRDVAVDLIYQEFLLREELGEAVGVEEYVNRFPDLAEPLRQQLEFHRAIEATGDMASPPDDASNAANEPKRPNIAALLGVDQADLGTTNRLHEDPNPKQNQWQFPSSVPIFPGYAPNAVLGRYTLEMLLGEGGMGSVWIAKQSEPVKRRVALKLIKMGMDSRFVMQRFETERQALAVMDHPNIARVYDGGLLSDGRPYFAMEFIDGLPINKFCDDAKLAMHERLELFVKMCHAVQHAHQKGIIHRDLKPANVLVAKIEGRPEPKVIDFGVAKAVGGKLNNQAETTQFGAVVGTLEYMAPEQAGFSGSDVDTRADVYALGVMLYELLTGLRPFESQRLRHASIDEVIRIIKEEEPSKPSTRLSESNALQAAAAARHTDPKQLLGSLRGDLDWIVMKCLEKERDRRYETANGLASDIRRFLADEPVSATPPSATYRFRKFLRRNKGPMFAAGIVLATLVMGIVGTSVGLVRADQRRVEAEKARDAESKAKREAETEKQKAFEARNAEASAKRAAEEEKKKAESAEELAIEELEASTDDAVKQLIGSKPELGPQERAYLQRTLNRWQAFAERRGNDARSQAIRAKGHFQMGLLWEYLGRNDEAKKEYDIARRFQQSLVDQRALEEKYEPDLAATHHNLANLLKAMGDFTGARKEFETARDLFKKIADRSPEFPYQQRNLALVQNNLGNLLADLGQWAPARKELDDALRLRKKLTELFSDDPDSKLSLASTHCDLGRMMSNLGERWEARKEFETARDLQMELVKRFGAPEYRRELAITHHDYAALLMELSEWEASQTEFETARDLYQALSSQFPSVANYQQGLAANFSDLGGLFRRVGNMKMARENLVLGRDLYKKLADQHRSAIQFQKDLANTANQLGMLHHDLGEFPAARKEYQAALELRKALAEKNPNVPEHQIELGGSYCNLGNLTNDEDKPAESSPWHEKAIAVLEPVHRAHPRLVVAQEYLRKSFKGRAEALDMLKKHAEAIKYWDRAIELAPPKEQPPLRTGRALSRHLIGDHAGALEDVERLPKSLSWDETTLYNFACVCAVGGVKIAGKKAEYSERAMDFLRQAVKAGWKDVAHLKEDADLDSLRERDDFKKLLAELEKASPPDPKKKP